MKGNGASTVLVVDDDKSVCELISSLLKTHGYNAVVTFNGREALDYLRAAPAHPGLILLDLMMPEMTGWEFRRLQEEDPALSGIPVAILTGLPDVSGRTEGIGAVDVLTKPSRVEDLTALVARFCS